MDFDAVQVLESHPLHEKRREVEIYGHREPLNHLVHSSIKDSRDLDAPGIKRKLKLIDWTSQEKQIQNWECLKRLRGLSFSSYVVCSVLYRHTR